MKQYFIILLFVFYYYINSSAQSPGYQGMKTSIYYDVYAMLSLYRPINDPSGKIELPRDINLRHSFCIDYVVSRKTSLGFSCNIINTEFLFNKTLQYNYFSQNNSGFEIGTFSNDNYAGQINTKCFGLTFKKFSRNYIAPVGSYVKFELLYITYNVKYNENELFSNISNYNGTTQSPHIKNMSPYNSLAIGITFGKQNVIFNHFIINRGVQFGWVFGKNNLTPSIFDSIDSYNEDNYIRRLSNNRLLWLYAFNAYIGIGYLIF
ncbi:MAG: hypothetical protein WC223_05925 [Bacteroidales bacterium]|jgi:hypothetical protein